MEDLFSSSEDRFVQLLLSIEQQNGGRPTKEAMQFLLQILVALSLSPCSVQLDFFGVFFRLLDRLPEESGVLAQLNATAARYTRVRVYCVENDWILRLLRMLVDMPGSERQDQLVGLCCTLAEFCITVREIRVLLRLMKSNKAGMRPHAWPMLLRVFQKSAETSPGPTVYWDFSGVSSGLVLPGFKRLPSTGISFCAWVRIEAFEHPALAGQPNRNGYSPVVLALCDERGQGLMVKFTTNFLVVQAESTGKKPVRCQVTFPFATGQWYHVQVSFEYHFIGSDDATVFIDGQMRGQFHVPYPKNAGPLTRSSVGCYKSDGDSFPHKHALIGQMSSLLLLEGPGGPAVAKMLYSMGPNASAASLAKVPAKVFVSYNPRAVDGALCLETSLGIKGSHALKLEGMAEVKQSDISEAVTLVGGPQVLLPLFAQLDLPLAIQEDSFSATLGHFQDSPSPINAAAVLELVQSSLHHPLAAHAMIARHGFHILGHVFRCVSPTVWDEASFASLDAIADYLIRRSEELHRAFFINIYLNFYIFIAAPVAVQKHVLQAMSKQVMSSPPYFRRLITVQRIVDGLRLFYWKEPSPGCFGRSDVVHSATGETLGERPKGNDLTMLRQMLLHIARSLMSGEPTAEELHSLIIYVLLAPDGATDESTDVLQLILSLLNEKSGPKLCKLLLASFSSGLGPLVSLVSRSADATCIWGIKLIGKVLQLLSEDLEANGKGGGSGSNMQSLSWLILLKSSIQGRTLTRDLYHVLLELCLESVDTAALSNPIRPHMAQRIQHPVVIAALMELLCVDNRPGARQRALSDLLHLLTNNDSALFNRRQLVGAAGWEARVLAVLASCRHHDVDEQQQQKKMDALNPHLGQDESVAIDVVSVLLQHLLMEGDWESASRLHATLDFFGQRGHLKTPIYFSKLLCGRAAEQLGGEAASVAGVCRNNRSVIATLSQWLKLAEMHLFSGEPELANALAPSVVVQWALSLGQLCEAVVAVTLENPDFELWSQTFRVSTHTLEKCFRLLESADIMERERKMGEMEAVLLGGMDRVAQPMVDALFRYKQEKTKGWRVEEEQSSHVFNTVAKRIQKLAPQFVARFEGKSASSLLCAGASLVDTLSALASAGMGNVRKDSVIVSLHTTAEAVARLGILPDIPPLQNQGGAQLLMELFSTKGPFAAAIAQARDSEREYVRDVFLREREAGLARQEEATRAAHLASMRETELENQAKQVWQTSWDAISKKENDRRRDLSRVIGHKNGLLESEWRKLVDELSSDRGPWSADTQAIERWKVRTSVESTGSSWVRILRRKNKAFDPHVGCARGTAADRDNDDGQQQWQLEQQRQQEALIESQSALAALKFVALRDAVDDEEDEEKSEAPSSSAPVELVAGSRLSCTLVGCGWVAEGYFEVSKTLLLFTGAEAVAQTRKGRSRRWLLETVSDIRQLRNLGQKDTLEFSMVGGKVRIVSFGSERVARQVYQRILSLKPRSLIPHHFSTLLRRRRPPSAASRLNAFKATERWTMGRMSNFDYIMTLNRLSGRSFGNLSYYPIMPWVVADWTSATLDLSDPATFRDLSFPAGALNPDKRAGLQQRYEQSDPSFHHGSHYSNAAGVLHWLVRQEPFTTLHLELQGGNFDHADRLFKSFKDAWYGIWNNPADAKELVPELFVDPAYLCNDNGFTLGTSQAGNPVDDVELPPWANSPEEFIALHRAALESEYVSKHLHLWIDLVFGVAQRGPRAVERFNVFFWTTYPASIDWSQVESDDARAALLAQVEHYGQCPDVIFKHSHPARQYRPVPAASVAPGGQRESFRLTSSMNSAKPAALAVADNGTVAVVCTNGVFMIHDTISHKGKGGTVDVGEGVSAALLALHDVNGSLSVFSAGHWEYAWRSHALLSGKAILASAHHLDAVTCFVVGRSVMVTGSKDTTTLCWSLANPQALPTRGCGHEGAVTCVAVCESIGIMCSGSSDGTVILRELLGGRYVRSFDVGPAVEHVAISSFGDVLVVSQLGVHLFHLGGDKAGKLLMERGHELIIQVVEDNATFFVLFHRRILVIAGDSVIDQVDCGEDVSAIAAGPRNTIYWLTRDKVVWATWAVKC